MTRIINSSNKQIFKDRKQAGQELAKQLVKYKTDNPIILALPRGGVPIGYEISEALNAPLGVIITRKIGLPNNKEFGVGAIGEDDTKVLDLQTLSMIGLTENDLQDVIDEEKTEMKRRVDLYRQNRPLPNLKNKTVILVDDGLATGVTARAAINTIKKHQPKKIIFASPVCAFDTAQNLRLLVDEIVCLATPLDLMAIGFWYQNFNQVSDDEVLSLLKKAQSFKQAPSEGQYQHL